MSDGKYYVTTPIYYVNFKPHIGALSNGELLMFVSHTHPEEAATGGTLSAHPVLYRSSDGGRTWSDGRHIPEMIGAHEPAVTIIDGVVFVTSVFLEVPYRDPYGGRGHVYCVIYRLSDDAFPLGLHQGSVSG